MHSEGNALMDSLGRKRWAIAEGWIPSQSSFAERTLESHETACILNTGDKPAQVRITIFFEDREPVGPYRVTVAAAAHSAFALQRSQRARTDPARHRLFVGVRVRCADRCAAHSARLAARRSEPALDYCLCRGVSRPSPDRPQNCGLSQRPGKILKPAQRNCLNFEHFAAVHQKCGTKRVHPS